MVKGGPAALTAQDHVAGVGCGGLMLPKRKHLGRVLPGGDRGEVAGEGRPRMSRGFIVQPRAWGELPW